MRPKGCLRRHVFIEQLDTKTFLSFKIKPTISSTEVPVRTGKPAPETARHPGLRVIALFKFAKGSVMLAFSVSVLMFLHRDVEAVLRHAVAAIHFDPEGHYLNLLLSKLGLVDDHRIKQVSLATFLYAIVQLTEGGGLWLGKHWAEYLTVSVTASLIPLEIYEVAKHPTPVRVAVLGINFAVVCYLVWLLRVQKKEVQLHGPVKVADPGTAA